jgi:hypothetical protein
MNLPPRLQRTGDHCHGCEINRATVFGLLSLMSMAPSWPRRSGRAFHLSRHPSLRGPDLGLDALAQPQIAAADPRGRRERNNSELFFAADVRAAVVTFTQRRACQRI